MIITNSNNNNIIFTHNDPSSSNRINPAKRAIEVSDDSCSSSYKTWNTIDKPKKKRKYACTYLNGFYSDSDFGVNSQWITDDSINVTDIFRAFRQRSIEGAQMRKYLSNSRTLSLSYIFLLSFTDNCTISKISPNKQRSIMTSALEKNLLPPIDIDVTLASREIQIALVNYKLTRNEVEDVLATIKQKYTSNDDVRVTIRIILDLLTDFLHNNKPNNRKQGEASLIIDNMKPYIIHCLVSQIANVKYDW